MSDHHRTERIDDVSAAFDLLRDARRRAVLYALRRDGAATVDELARRIAAWAPDDGEKPLDSEPVATSLVHVHLPKLADAGVVAFDRDCRTVELGDAVDDLDALLRCTSEHERGLSEVARAQSANA